MLSHKFHKYARIESLVAVVRYTQHKHESEFQSAKPVDRQEY